MSLDVCIQKSFPMFSLNVEFKSTSAPLGILGPSGCGKSMTLKCIAGIETPDKGYIHLNNRVLFDSDKKINLRPQQRNIGYLFQNYALFPHMTTAQNIACALAGNRAQKGKAIDDLLKRFSLQGLQKHYPSQLSGGQQQRVALARIWASAPEALLLDEPFSALDELLREAMQVEVRNLLAEYGKDAVMVTHNRNEVYSLCPNLMVLDNGSVQDFGNTLEMFQNPATLATARLTGCKNISRAQKLSEYTVHALDWGCTLQTALPTPATLTHVGVRAHYFVPCKDKTAANTIRVKVCEQIESPFERNILFTNADCDEATGRLWWKTNKESDPVIPDFLCVNPNNVLLLC